MPHSIFQKTVFILLLSCIFKISNSQEGWYYQTMYKNIQTIDTSKNTEQLKQCSIFFFRIWETNPADWLPAYYYVLTLLKCAENSGSTFYQNEYLSKAQEYTQMNCPRFKYNCEIEILQAKLFLLKTKLINDTNALTNTAIHLNRAFGLNKNNSRAYVIMAEYLFLKYNKSDIGQKKAITWLENALLQPDTGANNPNLQPSWGKKEAESLLTQMRNASP